MTTREAIILPWVFLTVALFGGFRETPEGGAVFLPPPLMALVLGLLLIGVLVRTGLLRIEVLFAPQRTRLARANAGVLVAALFAAATQVFNSLTPETGLLNLVGNLFYLLLLWNTLAACPDPPRLVRSLLVVFGGAFVFKYVLLAALYDPSGGLARRVVATLVEGVTLGTLGYAPHAPLTGYVAFFTTLAFLVGIALLPSAAPARRRAHREAAGEYSFAPALPEGADSRSLAPTRPEITDQGADDSPDGRPTR